MGTKHLFTEQASMYQEGIYHPLVLLHRTGTFCLQVHSCFEHCLTCSTLKCTTKYSFLSCGGSLLPRQHQWRYVYALNIVWVSTVLCSLLPGQHQYRREIAISEILMCCLGNGCYSPVKLTPYQRKPNPRGIFSLVPWFTFHPSTSNYYIVLYKPGKVLLHWV